MNNTVAAEAELLNELNLEVKEIENLINSKSEETSQLIFDEENEADDNLILDMLERIEDVDDEYNDDDDDDDDDLSHIKDSSTRKEMRKRFKDLRVKMKKEIKEIRKDKSLERSERRLKIKNLRKNFRKEKRSDRKLLRDKLRSDRKARRAARKEKRLSNGQRSGFFRIFRSILNKVKESLISVAIKLLSDLATKIDDKLFIKRYVLQAIEFLKGLKSSGLSPESTTGEVWSENSPKIDQFVSNVKDAAQNFITKAKITLKQVLEQVLKYLKDSNSPILRIASLVITPFI